MYEINGKRTRMEPCGLPEETKPYEETKSYEEK